METNFSNLNQGLHTKNELNSLIKLSAFSSICLTDYEIMIR